MKTQRELIIIIKKIYCKAFCQENETERVHTPGLSVRIELKLDWKRCENS